MTENAKYLLTLHGSNPDRSIYAMLESGLSPDNLKAAYAELLQAGYVELGNGWEASPTEAHQKYKLTANG